MRGIDRRLFLGALAGAGLAAPAVARPLDEVTASGILRVALYRDNAPFSDDAGGKPVGIDVDVAKRIAQTIGVKPEIRIVEASENVDGDFRLNLWRGDLAGSTLADLMLSVPADKLLQMRNELVFFTAPYVEQRLAIAYRAGVVEGGFQDLQDIAGKSVAVEGTSPVDALIGFANGGTLRESIRHYRNFGDAADAFRSGETQFLAGARSAIESTLAKAGVKDAELKDLAGSNLIRPRWELCGAVKTDSRDLAYRIGEALAEMRASGEMEKIFAAHGASFTPPAGY
ncbi:substrate-binding periplasmic protein [Chenggangzhangella methanolivorans]|uniref:Transporter substrate-binding domain-containing protein n=1 Tax=Chenggangzhangella methanolivorans TaxID=1437009 RepID=A0A9E6RB90_9HYPH|nr:transporter substrate-binding domain-containing protein [Chenggangzhangella methanolivorans]QZO01032.1 transporter substrate-binding domain-containing protein [Chenggangzhangella methanolivorans]